MPAVPYLPQHLLVSVKKRNGEAINSYLHEYYQQKAAAKPKMVALGAVMHKISNYIFRCSTRQSRFQSAVPTGALSSLPHTPH